MSIHVDVKAARGRLRYDIDLALPTAGITALFGPSGAGKTTLLRIIAGLDKIGSAKVRFGNSVWQDEHTFVPAHRRSVGYVFQETSLFPHLDVFGNIEYAINRARSSPGLDLPAAIELLGLQELLNRDTQTLSGGEKQRVAIARALAANPALLLLDEPLSAIDHEHRDEILPFLERLHDYLDIPVLYVSHSTDEVARIADFIVLMKAGSVQGYGPLGKLLTRLDLPLAAREDAEAVLQTKVIGYDQHNHINHLSFSGGTLRTVGQALPRDASIRVRIAARDVSITLEKQSGTSILNILPATIAHIKAIDNARILLNLQVGEQSLLARITRLSMDALDLKVGKDVFAQVKSLAVLS